LSKEGLVSSTPQDCDVCEPTTADFQDPSDPRAMRFIYWVRLCSIVGRVGDHLRRHQSGTHVAYDLLDELENVGTFSSRITAFTLHQCVKPLSLRLTSSTSSTLSLRYHTLLHLKKSTQGLPTAYTAAILSASCMARIFEEFLVRGSLRFLQVWLGWHIAIALLPLVHVRQNTRLQQAADDHIQVLRIALRQLAPAMVFCQNVRPKH